MRARARHHQRGRRATLETLSDHELVIIARKGHDSALEFIFDKYKNLVRLKARAYFLIGADREDLIQEGMIGLYKAIRDFRPTRQPSFRAFAEICITRQIITAIKTATRQKHIPLNSYVSFNKPLYQEEDCERYILDMLPKERAADPVELVLGDEKFKQIQESFDELLSGLESKALKLYVSGRTYQEIAGILGRHVKSIDNALQRVKRKIGMYLSKREENPEELLSS